MVLRISITIILFMVSVQAGAASRIRKVISRVYAAADFRASTVDATDLDNGATATLQTKTNFGATGWLRHNWAQGFYSTVYFSGRQLTFQDSNSGTTLEKNNYSQFGFGGTFNVGLKNVVGLEALLGMDQQAYLNAVTATAVNFEQYYIPRAGIKLTIVPIRKGRLSLGLSGATYQHFSKDVGDYEVKTNSSHSGRVYINQYFGLGNYLQAGLIYESIGQNTSLVDQKLTNYGLDLKFSFPIGVE